MVCALSLGPLPVPHGATTDPPIPAAGLAPETQALRGSGPAAAGRVEGWTLARQQLRALLLKRLLLASRSRCGLFAQVRGPRGMWGDMGACLHSGGLTQPPDPGQVPTLNTCSGSTGEPGMVVEQGRESS